MSYSEGDYTLFDRIAGYCLALGAWLVAGVITVAFFIGMIAIIQWVS